MKPVATQRGFTLVELMVSLVVASLMVAMILSIFMRMSVAYRGQQETSEVQEKLSAARAMIELDAKQAGYGISQGFSIATDGGPIGGGGVPKMHSPVEIIDSTTQPDTISFYYADPTVQAVVQAATTSVGNWPAKVIVDSTTGFTAGDLLVLSTPSLIANPLNPTTDGSLATYVACVVQIASITAPSTITLATAAPWGNATQEHCATPAGSPNTTLPTMVYKFVARSYRIDPDLTTDDDALQLSRTGLLNSATFFTDLAYGFTDLQVSGYFYDQDYDAGDSPDPDTDGARDWYSSTQMQTFTAARPKAAPFTPILQVAVSLVARTNRTLEGIGTSFTPNLQDDVNINNNMLGDHAKVDLSTTTDVHLLGNRQYRYTTFYTDLRNMGVGR